MRPAAFPTSHELVVRHWQQIARRAERRRVWRKILRVALAAVIVLGAVQMGAVVLWAARNWWPALLIVATHLTALGLAFGPSPRGADVMLQRPDTYLGDVVQRMADRGYRLRALRQALAMELLLLATWPLLRWAAGAGPLRWGVGFTVSLLTLAMVWSAERLVRTERREAARLQQLDGEEGA